MKPVSVRRHISYLKTRVMQVYVTLHVLIAISWYNNILHSHVSFTYLFSKYKKHTYYITTTYFKSLQTVTVFYLSWCSELDEGSILKLH